MSSNNELSILHEIEQKIAQIELPKEPKRLYEPIRYTLQEGGKRLRPMLLMLAYNIYATEPGTAKETIAAQQREAALAAAAAVEVFHNFTLLHDDIMDNATTRRGRETVHLKWSPNVAILSGDVMLIEAYRILAKAQIEPLKEVLQVFNKMAAEVCEGQQLDMDFEAKESVTVAQYIEMIRLKTAVLLGGATKIGAIIAQAPQSEQRAMQQFATELGVAFQLQDDLLDTYGDERLGKAIGGDIVEGKQTFLKITALQRANTSQREALMTTHKNSQITTEQKIERIKEIYDTLGVAQETEKEIAQRFEKALQALSKVEPTGATEATTTEAMEAMKRYARSLMNRER